MGPDTVYITLMVDAHSDIFYEQSGNQKTEHLFKSRHLLPMMTMVTHFGLPMGQNQGKNRAICHLNFITVQSFQSNMKEWKLFHLSIYLLMTITYFSDFEFSVTI